MMRIILIVLSGILISPPLFSNDSIKLKTNLIGVKTGYGNYRSSNPLESDNVYEGGYLPLGFKWNTYSEKYFDAFSFSYANINLKPSGKKDVNLTNIKAQCFNINYGYHRRIFNPKKHQLYAGANINGYVSLREISYNFIAPVNSTFSYKNNDLFVSFNISLAYKINHGDNILLANTNSSIMSFVTNRKYIIDEKPESDLLFFPQFKSLGFNANYFYKITPGLFLSMGYQFFYYSYPRSLDVLITKGGHSQLLTGIQLKF